MKNKIPWYIPNMYKTYWLARNVFKKPKVNVYFGKWATGLPVYKSKCFIKIYHYDLYWKDKYDTPRFEFAPAFNLILFGNWQLFIWLSNPIGNNMLDDDYWEQMLWYLYYYKNYERNCPDIVEAECQWEWTDQNNKSTWKSEFLIDKPWDKKLNEIIPNWKNY